MSSGTKDADAVECEGGSDGFLRNLEAFFSFALDVLPVVACPEPFSTVCFLAPFSGCNWSEPFRFADVRLVPDSAFPRLRSRFLFAREKKAVNGSSPPETFRFMGKNACGSRAPHPFIFSRRIFSFVPFTTTMSSSPQLKKRRMSASEATNGVYQADTSVPNLLVKRLSDKARLPTRGSRLAAGYDLYRYAFIPYVSAYLRVLADIWTSAEQAVIPPHGKALIDTKISIALPIGTYGRVAPRSGLGEHTTLISLCSLNTNLCFASVKIHD
jgi:hypothetical protein